MHPQRAASWLCCDPTLQLVLGDTNSCLSAIGAKRLHTPIFHMEAGNRCRDEHLPEKTGAASWTFSPT